MTKLWRGKKVLTKTEQQMMDEFYPKVLDALGNDTRRRIMDLLLRRKNEIGLMGLLQIRVELNLKNGRQLKRHLERLSEAGLIVTIRLSGYPEYSDYASGYANHLISNFGEQVMNGIWQIVEDGVKNWAPEM